MSADACREQALSGGCTGKVQSDVPAFHPYWGKTAVRNDMGSDETAASFEARSAPRSYPEAGGTGQLVSLTRPAGNTLSVTPAPRTGTLLSTANLAYSALKTSLRSIFKIKGNCRATNC